MPKDKHDKKAGDGEHSESKKKMVVVEEVAPEEEVQKVEESKAEEIRVDVSLG